MSTSNKLQAAFDYSVAPGVWGKKDVFVNYYIVQDDETKSWFLIDAGLPWSAPRIKAMVSELFGDGSKPKGIVLTHGHFDHIGALQTLAEEWAVPIYVHSLEMPYLTGKSAYPPADPTVGGGMMSYVSWMYPKGPFNLKKYIQVLPGNNTIPGLSGWKYIHTPGHAPGHISLFRERDKVLIAGDAVVTTLQESALYALSYAKKLSGPPKYFTCNWSLAKISVLKLAALDPEVIASGHGKPMYGKEMMRALHVLANNFDAIAQPAHGRYVNEPAITDETGVVYLPPTVKTMPLSTILGISLGVLAVGFLIFSQSKKKPNSTKSIVKTIKKLKRANKRYSDLSRELV